MPNPTVIDLDKNRSKVRKARPSADQLPWYATVIAFDPGGTTGWSMMHVHPEALLPNTEATILANILEWQHGQVDCGSQRGNLGDPLVRGISTTGEAAGANELLQLCGAWPGAAIVVEDFILRQFNQSRDLLSPVRITAALNQSLWKQSRDYIVQSPSEAKTTATDERLKTWGLYDSSGGMNHARDADRHAITFLRKAASRGKQGRAYREWAWPHLYGAGMDYGPEVEAHELPQAASV